MNYIFDKTYSQALNKLVQYIDSTKSWDLIRKITWASNEFTANELLVRNELNNLDFQTCNQLLDDIKFMSEFNTQTEREIRFKQHFCSTRLFDHYEDEKSRQMCQNTFNAIVNADGWEYFKSYIPDPEKGYMFSSDPQILKLMNAIDAADPWHSAASLGWTMRQLEQVAKTGNV